MNNKLLTVKAAAAAPREEEYMGRPHLVVPVVALVEGVIQALNSNGPEFVSEDVFSEAPGGWNGRPIFLGHPMKNGSPVSGNTPELLEAKAIGTVFNCLVRKKKLTMEAWLDIEKVKEVAPALMERIDAKEPIEISVGALVETRMAAGEYNGKKYVGEWVMLVPDHLALLPAGNIGACSREMGCGVRAAKGVVVVSEKKKTFGSMFARVLEMIRGAQPAAEMSDGDLRMKLYEALKEVEPTINYVEAFVPVTDPTRVVYSCYFPSAAVGPEMGMGYQYGLFERSFSLDADGAVTLTGDRYEVEPVVSYQAVDPALRTAAVQPKAAEGKPPCSCGGSATEPIIATSSEPVKETVTMDEKKIARVKALIEKGSKSGFTAADQAFLEAASDEQLARFEAASAVVETPKVEPVAAAVVETPKVEVKVAEVAKTPEEYIAAAPAGMRDVLSTGLRAANDRKAATIKALKASGRCKFSDAELEAKGQTELDQLTELANVRAAVDFSGQGLPHTENKATDVPAAPDMTAAIRAARGTK